MIFGNYLSVYLTETGQMSSRFLLLIPFKPSNPCNKAEDTQRGEDDGVGCYLHPTRALVEDAAQAIGKHGEGEEFDKTDTPCGEILIAEKDA